MLLQQKCYVEGAQLLGFYASMLVDHAHDADEAVRRDSHLLLELLTPIVKAWGSDYALKANELAIQILGGYGYTREYPVEQCYRDNRINPIHEGTNGIQALDLLGRKVDACRRRGAEAAAANASERGATPGGGRGASRVGQCAPLHASARTSCHRMLWLRSAMVASRALPAASTADADFYRGKLQACRFFFACELPQIELAGRLVRDADASALAMEPAWFH
jgi:hypothetical protein